VTAASSLAGRVRALPLPRLLTPAPRDPGALPMSPAERTRRRRVVVATLVVGAALLGATLAAPEGSGLFYGVGFALAATWLVGARLSGRIPVGRAAVVGGVVAGVLAWVVFLGLYLVLRRVPLMEPALDSVLDKANAGNVGIVLALALLNGVAEEVFFRGALPDAVGGRRAAFVATGIYVLVTAASLNVALVAAAVVMGTLFMLERLSTGGVLAPVLTHVTWSALMLLALPH
jgi:uncharacterized protein